jgi:hypothetical protein
MDVLFVNIPRTAGDIFEENFHDKTVLIKNTESTIFSVGHSWNYPTQIKGWRDWDYPNQKPEKYRDVLMYHYNLDTKFTTIIRNPFTLFIDYFISDWAWCKKYHNLSDDNTKLIFQEFVDIYLDNSIQFHAPAFKKSLFSQLKDKDGNWLINEKSFVLRYEQLKSDITTFGKMLNLPIMNYHKIDNLVDYPNWKSYYRDDQIVNLSKLWEDDLNYLGYSEVESNIKPKVKKPKMALCFSGIIRDIDYTKDFWLELIDKYDIDVYASFWDVETPELNDTIDNFNKIYNVKHIEVEPYSNFKKSTLDVITPQINPPTALYQELINYAKEFHTLSMWYKIWKCNMLTKSSDVEYDIIIRARTDSRIEGDLEIIQNNMFNVPTGRVYTDDFPKSDGINDIFSYGNPKVMDYVSSTFLYLMRYLNEGHYMIPPEHFLHVHLNQVDLNIRFFANKLIITRKSKGTADELYNRNTDIVEDIKPSNFMNPTPNKNMSWIIPIKDSLKF